MTAGGRRGGFLLNFPWIRNCNDGFGKESTPPPQKVCFAWLWMSNGESQKVCGPRGCNTGNVWTRVIPADLNRRGRMKLSWLEQARSVSPCSVFWFLREYCTPCNLRLKGNTNHSPDHSDIPRPTLQATSLQTNWGSEEAVYSIARIPSCSQVSHQVRNFIHPFLKAKEQFHHHDHSVPVHEIAPAGPSLWGRTQEKLL